MNDELGDITESSENRICDNCKNIHICKRCNKNTHICSYCGKMAHECDICGTSLPSLSSIKRHHVESKICIKARTMTMSSLQKQMDDFRKISNYTNHTRRKSCPIIMTEEQVKILNSFVE